MIKFALNCKTGFLRELACHLLYSDCNARADQEPEEGKTIRSCIQPFRQGTSDQRPGGCTFLSPGDQAGAEGDGSDTVLGHPQSAASVTK